MKPGLSAAWMAAVLGLAGCALTASGPVSKRTDPPDRFAGYEDFFGFVATNHNLPRDPKTVMKLAAESGVEVFVREGRSPVYVVTPHYYVDGIYDLVRGAQGNGSFYWLSPLPLPSRKPAPESTGFQLLGIGEGNQFHWGTLNGHPRLVTHSHISATEQGTNFYEWDGQRFRQVDPH